MDFWTKDRGRRDYKRAGDALLVVVVLGSAALIGWVLTLVVPVAG